MSTHGIDVFDKTLQTTHQWLHELETVVGPQRQTAWHVLGAVLRALRDRIPIELAAHLGSQLPILVRGAYYDQWRPAGKPERIRTRDELSDILWDMQGELGTSHAYVVGGDEPWRPHYRTGLLGADLTFDVEVERYRFARIYAGDTWAPGGHSPPYFASLISLAKPGLLHIFS